jgi:beta-N-acetylhexosaminidase
MGTMHKSGNKGTQPLVRLLVAFIMTTLGILLLLRVVLFIARPRQYRSFSSESLSYTPTPADTPTRDQPSLTADMNEPASLVIPSPPAIRTLTPSPTIPAILTPTRSLTAFPSSTATPSPTSLPSPTATRFTAEATATITSEPPPRTPDDGLNDEHLWSLVNQMPLADKVGQMMMVGFHGKSLSESPQLPTLISTYRIGSIVLLEANAHDPQQVARLIAEAQELAIQTGSHIPLFVAINHEGGIVVRITEGVTGFPGNMAIAASGRPEYAYTAAALAAQELQAMGINMNLAPVLDVNDNPLNPIIGVRSFGESPDLVVSLGRETIRGFQQNGVVAVAKHFPGHGSAAIDSHVGLPVINKPASQLEQIELPPFQMAVREEVEAIMTAHVVVPALEPTPGLPASLSTNILTGVLRDRMGFKGIIMTDSLGMVAIAAGWGQAQAAVEAVKAGADMVLSVSPLEAQIAIHQALITAVQNGEITSARIDESVLRVLRVKHKYRLFEWTPIADLSLVGSEGHQAVADEMALAAITLFKDGAGLVPLPDNIRRLLILSPDELPPASSGQGTLLGQELRQEGFEVTELVFNLNQRNSRDAAYAEALRVAPANDVVIFGEWELVKRHVNWSDQWQEKLVAALQQSGKPVMMIAWRDPGAILRVPDVPTFVIAYGTTMGQVRAVVKVITGQASPQGDLPLTIPLP